MLDPEPYVALAQFRFALRRFIAASEVLCRAEDVTAQQYQVLLAIGCGLADMTMKDLAEQLLLRSHAAVQLVNRMEIIDLVRRIPSQADGRSVVLQLTSKGEALFARLADRHLSEMLKHAPLLSAALEKLDQTS